MVSPHGKSINLHGAVLSRRAFVKSGGALIVGISAVGPELLLKSAEAPPVSFAKNSPDSLLASSWIEILADNTIVLHTGRTDFGQSTPTTVYLQLVAEELDFPIESITSVVMGDTDRTPDGGRTAQLLDGADNLRKAAAYTRGALLELAAGELDIDKTQLTIKDGVISGGGRRITFGQLIAGQQLTLRIPVDGHLTEGIGLRVTGNPPTKPMSQWRVIGKPYANYITVSKVAAKETWITDVRLPGMLHGRIVHPRTLGSKLVNAGEVDKEKFPNAELIVKGNLVGVIAPTEWEAIGAARQVAAATTWTDWKGLPGSPNLHKWLREEADWKTAPVVAGQKNQGNTAAALAGAAKTLSVSYEMPYLKHASIGPTVAVADVKSDGTVFVYAHTQVPQMLREQIAVMLGTSIDNVIVRAFAGSGHYGRSNAGNAGAEDDAVILSQAVGRPVRVQWMRPEDIQWSSSSPGSFSDAKLALDTRGNLIGVQLDHYIPEISQGSIAEGGWKVDTKNYMVGAVLSGLMTPPPLTPRRSITPLHDPWLYDRVPNLGEFGHGTASLGFKESPIAVGLRNHSLRTPVQMQQNFPRELAMSEAAALAGVDPIEFRIKHTTDQRLIDVLKAVRAASGWQTRPAPSRNAVSTGSAAVEGQGVSVILRLGAYWACVCQISVTPSAGKVLVSKCTVAVEPGIVINPLQLKRQVEGGAMMGISHALYEEMSFDASGITSRDWRTYPIASMADAPEMKVVILSKPEVGKYGGGSEAANASAPSAIAAAFFDATGKMARRLPLKPAYVQSILQA